MTQTTAATTRFRDPDTGKLLGVPEASASGNAGAITKYAPQWRLNGLASDPALAPGAPPAPAPVVLPIVHQAGSGQPVPNPEELDAVLAGQRAPVVSDAPVLTDVQARMAKARAARGRGKSAR